MSDFLPEYMHSEGYSDAKFPLGLRIVELYRSCQCAYTCFPHILFTILYTHITVCIYIIFFSSGLLLSHITIVQTVDSGREE